MKTKIDYIPCTDCLPISNLNGHKTFKGMLVHSRIDCPPDKIYFLNENNFYQNKNKKKNL